MSVIAILICVALERFWDGVAGLRFFGWFDMYKDLFNKQFGDKSFWKGYVKLAVLILPVVFLVFIVSILINTILGGIGAFVFSIVVLAYCIGPGNLYGDVKKCVIISEEGKISLVPEQIKACFGLSIIGNDNAARSAFSQGILSIANKRIFAVVFWFAVFSLIGLGPVGAVLYRLLVLCESEASMDKEGHFVQSVLDWVPARLLSLGYALMGNFIAVMPVWLSNVMNGLAKDGSILEACGKAAFGLKEGDTSEIDPLQALSLLDRALGVWVIVLILTFVI